MDCFIYDWRVIETSESVGESSVKTDTIFAFGVDKTGKSTVCRIPFKPHCHILLNSAFTHYHIAELQMAIKKRMNIFAPLTMVVVKRYRLYGAYLNERNERRPFLFLKCSFRSRSNIFLLNKILPDISTSLMIHFPLKICDLNANVVLQYICTHNLNTCGWVHVEPQNSFQKSSFQMAHRTTHPSFQPSFQASYVETLCDVEITASKLVNSELFETPKLVVCSFDIECVPEDRNKFPKASMPNDVCFQISCVLTKFNPTGVKYQEKYLLSLSPCDDIEDCQVLRFETEADLLVGYSKFLRQHAVNVVVGYNIFQFDIPYLIERSKQTQCYDIFCIQGFLTYRQCKTDTIKWASSAYQVQDYTFIDNDGRIFVDLLPVVQKEYKLENYKLDTVSKHFLNDSKNDLSPNEMFKCYDKHTGESMAIIGKYCIQDSVLVLRLYEMLQVFYSLQEMANVCRVPVKTLLLYGQQIKVFSQIYQYCVNNNFVVEKPDYQTGKDERYRGAMVFDPIPGLYENVTPFDFNSLYPTCIIANNFDYSTFVDAQSDIPDDLCNIFEWEDHVGCVHDTKTVSKSLICQKRRYRFLKEPKGILPTIIQELLDKRKATRRILATETDPAVRLVLNQRQLAYKVSANSMYGITGVKQGMLPLMPVAMCITYMGRKYVETASKIIKRDFGGDIVYGDTDSNYIIFPHIAIDQLYAYATHVSQQVSANFPRPIFLEFEDAIYKKFLIFTKKRYVYQTMTRDLKIEPKLGKTGVLLIRRDTFKFLKDLYEKIIVMIFDNHSDLVLDYIVEEIKKLLTRQIANEKYPDESRLYMTKSFNDFEGEVKDGRLGHYKVKMADDVVDRVVDRNYYISQLPALCQLANKILERGDYKFEGRRLEYVILKGKGKQADKIEHVEYFKKNREHLTLDYFYYFERMVEPIDQVIETVFKRKNFTKSMYTYHFKYKTAVMKQIESLSKPTFIFVK